MLKENNSPLYLDYDNVQLLEIHALEKQPGFINPPTLLLSEIRFTSKNHLPTGLDKFMFTYDKT